MPDLSKDWIKNAEIDYFSQFILLWLAFNSWYKSHYCEIKPTDRLLINVLKNDFTERNKTYIKFKKLIEEDPTKRIEDTKKSNNFKSYLEALHISLSKVSLKASNLKGELSFTNVCIDFSKKEDITTYIDLVVIGRKPKIKLGDMCLIKNTQTIFAGVIEILYQVRNLLIHGNLEPTDDNKEIVKYCYFILLSLLECLTER